MGSLNDSKDLLTLFHILNTYSVVKPPREYTAFEVSEHFYAYCTNIDTKIKNAIKKCILENNITGSLLLSSSIKNWKPFDFDNSERSKNLAQEFSRWRSWFRFCDIMTRTRLIVGKQQIESLNFDHVCQLFEERVTPSDMDERVEWYTYIEENSICGTALLEMSLDELKADLNLNKGQEKRLQKLLKLIQCDTFTMPSSSVCIHNSHVGGVSNGGQSSYRDISCN